jgi:histidinol phosphatase-like enzyme (inositol monophosphatase family)
MNQLPERLSFATGLAVEAGKITLKYFRKDVAVEYKSDASPVTIADRETELVIRAAIRARYPEHGLIGEEHGEVNPGAEWRWTIDPIDGTTAFIHGIPLYMVLLGLQRQGRSVLGVIHNPALEETVAAAEGCGCTFNGQPCHVSQVASLGEARVMVTDMAELTRRRPRFTAALMAEARIARGWGDAYGYLLVASGRAEAALDPILHVWDAVPLQPVIEQAGGRYTDFSGAAVAGTSGLASNGVLHERLLELARLDAG